VINSSVIFERGLPHFPESERVLIAQLMTGRTPAAELFAEVSPHHFHLLVNQTIAIICRQLDREGMDPDRITVAQALMAEDQLESVGGLSRLADYDNIPRPAKWQQHAEMVRNAFLVREMIVKLQSLTVEAIESDGRHVEGLVEKLAKGAQYFSEALAESKQERKMHSIQEYISEAGGLEKFMHPRRIKPVVPWPFFAKNGELDGFREGEVIVIAARPGEGKTALMVRIMEECIRENVGFGVYSLEMAAAQITERLVSCMSQIDIARLREHNAPDAKMPLFDSEEIRRRQTTFAVSNSPFYITDEPNRTVASIRSMARPLVKSGKIGAIFIDYLQLMKGSGQYEARHEQVAEISRDLKNLAMELKIPVIVAAQLKRESFGRRPRIDDIRESSAIEQDADTILLIHPKSSEVEPDSLRYPAEIIVGKRRNGRRDVKFEVEFKNFCTRFDQEARTDQ